MSKIHRLLVVGALLLVTACSHQPAPASPGGGSGGGGGAIPASFTLDSAHAADASVGAGGGTVTATGSDGTTYTLTVPAGALATAVDLTVTPLKNVSLDGASAPWQVGVELGPSGTQFLAAVTLHVVPPAGAPAPAALAQVDGSGAVFVPVAPAAAGASFDAGLWHFSDYVVASVTGDRLKRAAAAAIAAVHDPATADDIRKLARLLVAAQAAKLTDVVKELEQALAAAVASYADAQQSNASPTGGTVLGGLVAYQVVGSTGLSNEVATLQQSAQGVFGTWMRVLDLAYLKATTSFADLQALVPSYGQAVAMTKTYPFLLQAGGVLDPSTDAQKIIENQLVIADADCNNARFKTGLMELQDLIGGVHLLGVSSPSAQQLQDDASTCVPPSVTAIEVPADVATAQATTALTNGQPGTVNQDVEPVSATIGNAVSAGASAVTADSSADANLVVTVKTASTTFAFSGQATGSVGGTSDAGCASSGINVGGSTVLKLHFDHARGPVLVKISTAGGSVSKSGKASATLAVDVAGTTLWANGLGAETVSAHLSGLGWAPGQPDPSDAVLVDLQLFVSAGICAGAPADGSASASGTFTVQVLPDPQKP